MPGRMAPTTAIIFLASATAAYLLPYGKKHFLAVIIQSLILFIFFTAIISLLIYSLKWEFIFSWYHITRMAAHSAVGFILVSIILGVACNHMPWFKEFYEHREDKKIMVLTGVIFLFIILVSSLASISRLTILNINAAQQF